MSPYATAAIHIMDCLHHAEDDLVGKTVVLFDGAEGVIKAVKLDDHHGLCFTFEDPHTSLDMHIRDMRKWRPVSTIKQKD
jgi:hypothetical protein